MGVERFSRRRTVGLMGSVALGGLAGCLGDGLAGDGDDSGTYSVTMEPVGELAFEGVPEQWATYTGDWADMGVALGHADGLTAIGLRERFGTHHYDGLSDVEVDPEDLTELWQGSTDTEQFYALEADLHVIDPHFMINQLGWSQADVDEIDESAAPFFGNSIYSRSYGWHDYEYYTLYEAFEKLAEVFQETERYDAFAELHDEVVGDVADRIPEDSPSVAVLAPDGPEPDAFYGYTIDGGTQTKHLEELDVTDALAESGIGGYHETGGTIDYETLLTVDPDAIIIWQEAGVDRNNFEEAIVEYMADHNTARNLRAVENDRVVFGGLFYQGPIIHLFQLEMVAQGLYPDEFAGEDLFDRDRVSEIVNEEY